MNGPYIKLATGEYPRYEGDIRLEHPGIEPALTGPDFPCPADYAEVQRVDPPSFDPDTQAPKMGDPVEIDGVWTMTWTLRDLTQSELDAIAAYKARIAEDQAREDALKADGDGPDVVA